MSIWQTIDREITAAMGRSFTTRRRTPVGGGSINRAYRLEGANRSFFVKLNDADRLAMFEAEAAGLEEIRRAQVIKTPQPVCSGSDSDQAFLVLEWIPVTGTTGPSQELLGTQLAAMHRVTRREYGWYRNNTIGSTPQSNTPSATWNEFWKNQRLGFQLELAGRNGYGNTLARLGDRLMARIDAFFVDYAPAASLVHGDLWSGNHGADEHGNPVIFDPAVYYGDRETDIAMTELFGGFTKRFYHAYQAAYPLDAGYKVRRTLYNLYHILNHLNIFGESYLHQAETMIQQLLSEID